MGCPCGIIRFYLSPVPYLELRFENVLIIKPSMVLAKSIFNSRFLSPELPKWRFPTFSQAAQVEQWGRGEEVSGSL
jgi:hypothetical protein